jgi:polyisoprenoid-binding protein YceI
VTKSTVTVTIQAAAIDTDSKKRDAHLRTKDFFAVGQYPEITFRSESIVKKGDGYVLTGALTIKGHTHPVELPFTFTSDKSADGKPALHAEASGAINRRDFGIDYGGNFSVGKVVKIAIHIQAIP